MQLAAAVGSDLSCRPTSARFISLMVSFAASSAEVITGTTTQITQTVGALNSLLQLITSSVVATGLLTGLLLINAPVAWLQQLWLCIHRFGYYLEAGLRTNSHQIAEASTRQVKALQEGLGAIRDVA